MISHLVLAARIADVLEEMGVKVGGHDWDDITESAHDLLDQLGVLEPADEPAEFPAG